MATDT